MAQYTITIRTLQDNHFDFGLKDYPIFDEQYRNVLNNNILNYYYESEIGVETPALFKKLLNDRMSLIMSKYNNLYLAQRNVLENVSNLFHNVDLQETFTGNNETSGTSSSNSSSSGNSRNRNLFQDTPQGKITIADLDPQNQVYATSYTLNQTNNSNAINDTSNTTGTGSNEYVKSIVGNNGKYYNYELLQKVETSLLNIDEMIINELSDLFMGIF